MKENPDWLVERKRLNALLDLARRRGDMDEAAWRREMQTFDESGDLYRGYVDGLTPQHDGAQAQLV